MVRVTMFEVALFLLVTGACAMLVGMFTSPWMFGGGVLFYAGGLAVMLTIGDQSDQHQ